MANYPQALAQDAVCQSHTGHMTGLWFLPTRPLRLNTNEWMNQSMQVLKVVLCELQRVNRLLFISSAVFSGTFAPLHSFTCTQFVCFSTEVYLVPRDPAVVFVIFFYLSVVFSFCVFFFFWKKKLFPLHYVGYFSVCISSNTLCSINSN